MGPNLAQRKAVGFYFNLSFCNQRGCGSRRGNVTCPSVIGGGVGCGSRRGSDVRSWLEEIRGGMRKTFNQGCLFGTSKIKRPPAWAKNNKLSSLGSGQSPISIS